MTPKQGRHMYVGVVPFAFCDRPNGAGRVAEEVATAFADAGWQSHLVSMTPEGCDRSSLVKSVGRVRVHRYPTALGFSWLQPRWHRRHLEPVLRQIGFNEEGAILHVHSPVQAAGLRGLVSDAAIAVSIHSPALLEARSRLEETDGVLARTRTLLAGAILQRLERQTYVAVGRRHVLSTFMAAQARARGWGSVDVVPLWPPPLSDRDVAERGEARHELGWDSMPTAVTVRRLVSRTGVPDLIACLAPAVKRGHLRLVVVGEGPQAAQVQSSLAALGENGIYLGRVADGLLASVYTAADVTVLPSRDLECFGLPALEAMSRGCPVVATDIGALPESVVGAPAGRVVPPKEPSCLAEAVFDQAQKGSDPEIREALRDYVNDRYGRDQLSARLRSALGGTHSTSPSSEV